jgi:tetratricopeptide (TPR) repeat protein
VSVASFRSQSHSRAETVAVSADGRWAAVGGAGQSVTVADLVSGREILALPPEGSDVWCLAWAPDGTKLAVGLSDGGVAVWDLEAVRARLVDFGFDSPSTARAEGARTPSPVPAFDQVVRVNGLRVEAERARHLATSARDAGDYAAERDQLLAALELDKRMAETVPDAPGHRKRLAWTHAALARALGRRGDTVAALSHLDAAAELLKRLALDDPANPEYRRLRAYGLSTRSVVLKLAGRRAEAIDAARQDMAARKVLADDPGTPRDRTQLSVAYCNLGIVLFIAGQNAEAERWYKAALAVGDQLTHDHPAATNGPTFRSCRGAALYFLGVLRVQAGDPSGAVKLFREAAAIRARLVDHFPKSVDYLSEMGQTLEWLGVVLRDLGQLEESSQQFREAARRQRSALDKWPKDKEIRRHCCNHQAQLAITLQRLGRHAEAADAIRELPRLAPDDPAVLLRAARLLAGCVAVAEQNPGFPYPVGLVLARVYGSEAIALARAAVATGLVDVAPLWSDPDFDPVRSRDEFRRLLDELKGRKE